MLNLEPELAGYLFDFGLLTNPEPNPTTFSLQHLGSHNILEHDASFRSVRYVILFYVICLIEACT